MEEAFQGLDIALAKLLGIIAGNFAHDMDFFPPILRDLDLTVESTKDDKTKISMLSIKADLANKHAWHYCSYMIILKKFLRQTFPNLTHALGDRVTEDQNFVRISTSWLEIAFPDNGSDAGVDPSSDAGVDPGSAAGDDDMQSSEMQSYENMSLLMISEHTTKSHKHSQEKQESFAIANKLGHSGARVHSA